MNVVVFGAGYVGLVTGTVLAYIGHTVTLIDVAEDKVQAVNAQRSPIYEPGLEPLIAQMVSQGRLRAAMDPAVVQEADAVFIAVGTPPLPTGAPDLSYVEEAARTIGAYLRLGARKPIIVNKATVPIGSAHLVAVWVSEGSGDRAVEGEHFAVASNPEFLREGTAVFDTLYPDRIVLGTNDEWVRVQLRRLYEPIITRAFAHPTGVMEPLTYGPRRVPVVVVDPVSSEMIKYAANAFLAMKISFVNEMATVCELVGADVTRVAAGIGADSRIGSQFLQAGVGWGGSCFSKDVASLVYTAHEYGYDPMLLQATQHVNEGQRLKIVQHVLNLLKPVKGRKVAVWGLAFKPGTDDVRDTPAHTVIQELLKLGVRVSAFDPVASYNFQRVYPEILIRYERDPITALHGADALIILTEWPQFHEIALSDVARTLNRPILIDGRNTIDPTSAARAGLLYRGVGRFTSTLTPALGG